MLNHELAGRQPGGLVPPFVHHGRLERVQVQPHAGTVQAYRVAVCAHAVAAAVTQDPQGLVEGVAGGLLRFVAPQECGKMGSRAGASG